MKYSKKYSNIFPDILTVTAKNVVKFDFLQKCDILTFDKIFDKI